MLRFIDQLSKDYSGIEVFAIALAFLLAIFLALSFHEFAHAFVANKAGDDTPRLQGRLTLNPFKHIQPFGMLMFFLFGFGWAKPVEVNPLKFKNYRRDMAKVAVAGVITNIILDFIFAVIYGFILGLAVETTNYFQVFLEHFVLYSMIVNVSLAVFNLLPVYPLDGFKLLQVFLKPNNKFLLFMLKYGQIVLLIFIITPIFTTLHSILFIAILQFAFIIPGLFF